MFGDHPLGGKRPFFADTSLLSLAVSTGYGLQKAPSRSEKMTLFSAKSNHQTRTELTTPSIHPICLDKHGVGFSSPVEKLLQIEVGEV